MALLMVGEVREEQRWSPHSDQEATFEGSEQDLVQKDRTH